MASGEERMMILRMVEEGKITPEEGARLLAALGERQAEYETVSAADGDRSAQGEALGAREGGNGASWARDFAGAVGDGSLSGRVFRVRVSNAMTGKQKVDVNIPLGLVDFGLRFIPPNAKVDMHAIRHAIQSGATGRIVDVQDNEKGDHVEILIE